MQESSRAAKGKPKAEFQAAQLAGAEREGPSQARARDRESEREATECEEVESTVGSQAQRI